MLSTVHVKTMAAYNLAMNERIYDCCARLSNGRRKRKVGGFFKSINVPRSRLERTEGAP